MKLNEIKCNLFSAITIQLSQGALQSPEPEPPWSKHNGDRGRGELSVNLDTLQNKIRAT